MSQLISGEPKQQEAADVRNTAKCRIPQRLPVRQRTPLYRPKAIINTDAAKMKSDTVPTQQMHLGVKNGARPRSNEPVRPKSANRAKDELVTSRQYNMTMRSARPERERLLAAPKRPSAIPKRVTNNNASKITRPVITVPVMQRPGARGVFTKVMSFLPDQDIIKQREDLEMNQGDLSDSPPPLDFNKKESIEKLMQVKITWQEKMVQFEKMKNDLKDRQNAIMSLYASMHNTYHQMTALGQKANLPPPEDLRIMNVAKMTPEQLLQLCADSNISNRKHDGSKFPINFDINKLYKMPTKLISTCDQTLVKRKEMIEWFDELLKAKEKCISSNTLSMRINEFSADNKMLKSSLDRDKAEFSRELEEVIDTIRKAANKTVALELQLEDLTLELSKLDSQNADLRKQISNANNLKPSYSQKHKIEDLEKQLKEEQCKQRLIKGRLTQIEGQVKMHVENTALLEARLEQSQAKVWTLERTVQQSEELNQNLQSNFDIELNKLTESIRENTIHLEEIADAREKLQKEKEDLEKRLGDLSEYYNESIKNMKHEMNLNIGRMIETQKKYDNEVEEKKKVEARAETVYDQLIESGKRQKELLSQLQDQELKLKTMSITEKELETTKHDLELSNKEVEEYKNRIMIQSAAIEDIERSFNKSKELEEHLKQDLLTKEEYITELEKKQLLLEEQLQESERKMNLYEEQLTSLKNHISELQEDFGEFENLDELHEMVNQQRANLLEATRQNGELAEALQKKDIELDRHIDNLTEQEHLIKQRDDIIKMLSEKDEEQANIIKLLQNNLEIRTLADSEINQQLAEKNAEIESLINNVETRKKQISQMEKIILTLEDQTRKFSLQIRKYQDKTSLLENKIIELETYNLDNKRILENPTDNLDNLIKLLEDELGTTIEPHLNKERECVLSKKKHNTGDRLRDKPENNECNGSNKIFQAENETIPTKIVLETSVKKPYLIEEQFKGDNLDRKKAITNMDTQNWNPNTGANVLNTIQTDNERHFPPFRRIIPHAKENYLSRNLHFFASNQLRDEKNGKMFKFAGHRL